MIICWMLHDATFNCAARFLLGTSRCMQLADNILPKVSNIEAGHENTDKDSLASPLIISLATSYMHRNNLSRCTTICSCCATNVGLVLGDFMLFLEPF